MMNLGEGERDQEEATARQGPARFVVRGVGIVDVATNTILALGTGKPLVLILVSVGRCVVLWTGYYGLAAVVVAGSAGLLALAPTGTTLATIGIASSATFAALETAAAAAWSWRLGRRRSFGYERPLLDEKKEHGWWRLVQQSRPEWPMMCGATVCLFLGLLAQLALPTLFGSMIDAISDDGRSHAAQRRRLLAAFSELLVLLGVSLVFTAIRSYAFNLAGEKVVARVRRKLFDAMLAQDIAWFDQTQTGDLMNRLSSDTTKLQSAATESISMLLRSIASAIVSLALLFATSWFLALVTIAAVPLVLIVGAISVTKIKRLSSEYQTALAEAANVAQETISNVRVVRGFSAERFEGDRYADAVRGSYVVGVRRARVLATFVTLMSGFGFASCVVVLYVGGELVIRGDMSVGDLISFVMYLVSIAESLGLLAGLLASVQDAVGASTVIFEIIDRVPDQIVCCSSDSDFFCGEKNDAAASCEFRDVFFAYKARPDLRVLNGVSFRVLAGQRAAFCGPSGSGKSTIFSLLERFYDPDSGAILIDDVDVSRVHPAKVRDQLALVAQEPALFSGTIADNIAYSRLVRNQPVDRSDVVAVAKAARVHDFVDKFPQAYETRVGERGLRLSGGQKQRVAIARALFVNPRVCLFDEATSALDAESEAKVQAAIDRLLQGRTSLTIAHRLSTVRDADFIAVVSKGSILATGTHALLLQSCPAYQALVKNQLAEGGLID
ncbi:hypothetical protein CTAYLR_002996 [Chrysophaeum taylorii]|uniref:Uncharacterized protein n=1 Tax=Chrysophaeum taylorii TaxID=2483200 RepID=A0AAD7U6X7_9STRA|nr:hypothetical protein CTAYLR_002996 [Chrysophaeum taylorii]